MARMALKDRREELIAAAMRVVTREGVARTTTRSIVREADMTLGAFPYCFDSREDLLQEVITRVTDGFVLASRQACAGETQLRPAIDKSLHAFWEGVQASPVEQLAGSSWPTTRCGRRAWRSRRAASTGTTWTSTRSS